MRTFTVKSLIIEKPHFVRKISIQTVIKKGIPTIRILGIPYQKSSDLAIKIQTIFLSNKIQLPYENIQVNISPSTLKQYPGYLELSIFMSIYLALKEKKEFLPIDEYLFLGELTLLGEIETLTLEDLSMFFIHGKYFGFRKFIIPTENDNFSLPYKDLSYVKIRHIREIINNNLEFTSLQSPLNTCSSLPEKLKIHKNILQILPLIAGKHSIFLLEKEPINKLELLNTIKIFLPSIKNHELDNFIFTYKEIRERPIITINSNITKKELLGDKNNITEGILYNHQFGLLLINDINFINKDILLFFKSLLENHSIKYYNHIIKNTFWLIFTSIPCPCGNIFNPYKTCNCSHKQIVNFHKKFDLYLKNLVDSIYFIDNEYIIISNKKIAEIKEKIDHAIEIQFHRYKNENFFYNSEIPYQYIESFCLFEDQKTESYWKEKIRIFNLNEIKIIRRIAQTICDYHGNPRITKNDIDLSIQLRNSLYHLEEPRIYQQFSDPLK
jgi:magnesium chelatase family protein